MSCRVQGQSEGSYNRNMAVLASSFVGGYLIHFFIICNVSMLKMSVASFFQLKLQRKC